MLRYRNTLLGHGHTALLFYLQYEGGFCQCFSLGMVWFDGLEATLADLAFMLSIHLFPWEFTVGLGVLHIRFCY